MLLGGCASGPGSPGPDGRCSVSQGPRLWRQTCATRAGAPAVAAVRRAQQEEECWWL